MAERFSFGPFHLSTRPGQPAGPAARAPETPFRILVLGDFSGRANRGQTEPVTGRHIIPVDLDNLEGLPQKLQASLRLCPEESLQNPVSLAIRTLEAFHPDHLFNSLEWFAADRQLRPRLMDPRSFADAAAEFRRSLGSFSASQPVPKPQLPATTANPPAAPVESTGNMLERLLGRPASAPSAPRVDISRLIQEAVKGSAVAKPDPQQKELVAAFDAAASVRMRAVLHHPDFQALEAAWRGLDFLVKNVELDESLQLYVMDLSLEELARDVTASQDLRQTGLYQSLVVPSVETPGGQPWAVILGNFFWPTTGEAAGLLARLGAIARAAGAPFLAGITPPAAEDVVTQATGLEEDDQAWNTLRQSEEAIYLGLACPRFLLRLPYGERSDAIESFDFRETSLPPLPQQYLWGNPAWACGCLLAQSFSQNGWDPDAGVLSELSGLPLHVYKEEGESKMTPCAEMWLNDLNSDRLLQNGFIPLQSIQGRDAIRLARLQSLHAPPTALAGLWS